MLTKERNRFAADAQCAPLQTGNEVLIMQLYHDTPVSRGVENAIKRSKQLATLQWTPVGKLPTVKGCTDPNGVKTYHKMFLSRYRPQTGVIYSSVRLYEKYVGYNVSLETYMTALANPNSVLYTRCLHDAPGHGVGCYYGSVCSSFVSYTLDLPYRMRCKDWPGYPGITPVDSSKLENLRLCDIVLNVSRHIAIITDIERDVEGTVHFITVSECTQPNTIALRYTPEEFREHWLNDGYVIYRYDGLDRITYTPSPFVRLEGDPVLPEYEMNRTLMLDLGNRANYVIGEEDVEISVFEDGWQLVRVTEPDGTEKDLPITDGKVRLVLQKPGSYRACCVNGDRTSAEVEWCAVDLQMELDKKEYRVGEPLYIRFRNASDERVFVYHIDGGECYERQKGFFTPEQSAAGELELPPLSKPGAHRVMVAARNEYGVYRSRYFLFEVTE